MILATFSREAEGDAYFVLYVGCGRSWRLGSKRHKRGVVEGHPDTAELNIAT